MNLLIDRDIFKTQEELAQQTGKSVPAICKAIKKAEKKGIIITKIELNTLYDTRTLPKEITEPKK